MALADTSRPADGGIGSEPRVRCWSSLAADRHPLVRQCADTLAVVFVALFSWAMPGWHRCGIDGVVGPTEQRTPVI
jgi:hypothetical protein